MTDFLMAVSVWALPVILAVTLHEAAHGFAALAMGDDTARRAGRVSLNPLRHVDPFGTVILPGLLLAAGGVLFGWAKPVPVDFSRLRPVRLGLILVAAAGPGANLLLALLAVLALRLLPLVPESGQDWVLYNLGNAIYINILLAVFNMLPIPPLDGGRVVTGLLPWPLAWRFARLERVGMVLLLVTLLVLPMVGEAIGLNLNPLGWLVGGPVQAIVQTMLGAFGPGA